MDTIRELLAPPIARNLVLSIGLAIALLLVRQFLTHWVRRASIQSGELRRRWIVQVRNGCFLLFAAGLAITWASELHTIALSLVAFIVAVVLATKELILCVTGSFLKISSRSFSIGDRIEVGSIRGDVVNQTLLTTTVLEIGPGQATHQATGRAVTLPNSVFLNTPVINESFTHDFVLHVFSVPVSIEDDLAMAEAALLRAADKVCEPFLDEAREHIARMTLREGYDTPSVDPRVTLSLPEPKRVNLIVRVAAPARQKGRVEQEIIRGYLAERRATTNGGSAEAPD